MAISPARRAAFEILMRVETADAYASELLQSERLKHLSPEDRALAYEITMGVLRWRSRLDAVIAFHSFTPMRKLDQAVLTALRMGAYQSLYLDRIPRHAAVHESVELVKASGKSSASSLANAVLRKISAASPLPKPKNIAEEYAHPTWLVERWIECYGAEVARGICEYDQLRPQQHVRVRAGYARDAVSAELAQEGVDCVAGELSAHSLRVTNGDATQTAAFRARKIAIQDAGSQWVGEIAVRAAREPRRILDCCAAPGGKTMVLAEAFPDAQITAAELHAHRAATLRKLCDAANVTVVEADVTSFDLGGDFDLVLADVPCTGTGTLARHPEIKWKLQPADIADLQARQLAIVRAALRQCREGGALVYSTCSLEREEGEVVVESLVRDGGCTLHETQRSIPGREHCDGFFVAVLTRGD